MDTKITLYEEDTTDERGEPLGTSWPDEPDALATEPRWLKWRRDPTWRDQDSQVILVKDPRWDMV